MFVVMKHVMPYLRNSPPEPIKLCKIWSSVVRSSEAKASSRMMVSQCEYTARARAYGSVKSGNGTSEIQLTTRCRCPPDSLTPQ